VARGFWLAVLCGGCAMPPGRLVGDASPLGDARSADAPGPSPDAGADSAGAGDADAADDGHADGNDDAAATDAGPDAAPATDAAPFADWFDEVTSGSGVDVVGARVPLQQPDDPLYVTAPFVGNGCAIADFDGDGRLDLAIAAGWSGATRLYRNLGGLRFAPLLGDSAGAALPPSIAVAFADLDGDGDPDLILADPRGSTLYENDGAGSFSPRLSLATPGALGVLPGDFDGDGQLDLYFYAHAPQLSPTTPGGRMFQSRGGFDFADVTSAWGLSQSGLTWVAALYDYDDDGLPDLYLANDTGTPDRGRGDDVSRTWLPADSLLRNTFSDGVRRFVERAAAAGIDHPRSSMGALLGDWDGDGALDLFVSNVGRNPLLLVRPDGTFVNAVDRFGLSAVYFDGGGCAPGTTSDDCLTASWGAARFDVDQDGIDDLVVVRGSVWYRPESEEQPAGTWRGLADGTFTPVSTVLDWMAARSLLAADLDGDGDLDLLVTTHGGPVRLFENRAASGTGWLRVRLRGSRSNADGVGARVLAHYSSGRTVVRAVGSGGVVHSLGPPEAHFTVAPGDAISELEVLWPSGASSRVAPVASGTVLLVSEP
jgi:hypothetical protein